MAKAAKSKETKKGKGKGKAKTPPAIPPKKNDLVYDKTVYNDNQAWREGKGVECQPDESDYNQE